MGSTFTSGRPEKTWENSGGQVVRNWLLQRQQSRVGRRRPESLSSVTVDKVILSLEVGCPDFQEC